MRSRMEVSDDGEGEHDECKEGGDGVDDKYGR